MRTKLLSKASRSTISAGVSTSAKGMPMTAGGSRRMGLPPRHDSQDNCLDGFLRQGPASCPPAARTTRQQKRAADAALLAWVLAVLSLSGGRQLLGRRLVVEPARSQCNVEVARSPANALLANAEGLELSAEGRHRERLLVPLLAPGAVALVEILRGQARAAGSDNPFAVEALDIAVGQERLATDLVVIGTKPARRRLLLRLALLDGRLGL